MNLTLRQLQIFASVAKHLSFTKAASELHLTQPAVSMQVKLLEEATGLELFERVSKRLQLSAAGTVVLGHCTAFRDGLEALESDIARLKGVEKGILRLSTTGTANAFVTLLVAEYCRQYPSVTISLSILNRSGLLRSLTENDTDLVIMGAPPTNLPVVGEQFMDNPLVVIAAPGHKLTSDRTIPLQELMEYEFVVRENGSGTRIAMERFCNEQGVTLKTAMEVSSNESIKQAVAAGLGLGIVSLHTLELELALKRIAVLRAEAFPIMRRWNLVQHELKNLSPAATAFRQFVVEQATSIWSLSDVTRHH